MPTLAQNFLSLADIYKRQNPDGTAAQILEILNNESQDIMTDFVMMECNDGTKHVHTIRTGLPAVSWGALYEGIEQSKSQTQQVADTTGFVEALSTVDKRMLDLAGSNRAAMRMSESRPFIESMAQELVTAMFYHNSATNARLPRGLSARFGVKATSGYGSQIVDAGGSGSDNTSVWFVTHGEHDFVTLYPKGTQGGIKQEDKGEQRVTDASGNPYYVEEELITAHMGFAVRDYRNIVRIANIDVSDMQGGSVDLYTHMRKAYYKLHRRKVQKVADQMSPGRTVIYANRDVLEALDALATNKGSADNFVRLRWAEVEGKEILTYRGFPIRETSSLLNTEARVV
jgi:hypothetical protein